LPDGSRLITQVTLPAAPPTGAAEKRAIHQGWAIRPHVVCHRKVILRLCRPSEHGWTLIIEHHVLRLGRLANASPDQIIGLLQPCFRALATLQTPQSTNQPPAHG